MLGESQGRRSLVGCRLWGRTSLGGDDEGGECSQTPQDSNIWECVKAMNTL